MGQKETVLKPTKPVVPLRHFLQLTVELNQALRARDYERAERTLVARQELLEDIRKSAVLPIEEQRDEPSGLLAKICELDRENQALMQEEMAELARSLGKLNKGRTAIRNLKTSTGREPILNFVC